MKYIEEAYKYYCNKKFGKAYSLFYEFGKKINNNHTVLGNLIKCNKKISYKNSLKVFLTIKNERIEQIYKKLFEFYLADLKISKIERFENYCFIDLRIVTNDEFIINEFFKYIRYAFDFINIYKESYTKSSNFAYNCFNNLTSNFHNETDKNHCLNNIVYICDSNMVELTLISAFSLLRNVNHSENYVIHIFGVNCFKEILIKLPLLCDENIRIYNLTKEFNEIDIYRNRVTSTAIYKFFIPELLCKEDKALYIDCDTIVVNDIEELCNYNLVDEYACVTRDLLGLSFHNEHLRINHSSYFNSGLMLLNLRKLRKENASKKMLNIKLNYKNIKYMDQDIFNIYFNENVKFVSNYFNYMVSNDTLPQDELDMYIPELDFSKIKIIHYTFNKPWQNKETPFNAYWLSEYELTFNKKFENYKLDDTSKYNIINCVKRNKSVLIVETANCHGEMLPGLIKFFQDKKYKIDVLLSEELDALKPIDKYVSTKIRKFTESKSIFVNFLNNIDFRIYDYVIFTTKSIYDSLPDNRYPYVFDYFKLRDSYNNIYYLEHRLEKILNYQDKQEKIKFDKTFVLANPQNLEILKNKVVNLPFYMHYDEQGLHSPITFVTVGTIEQKRRNHNILINICKNMYYNGRNFKIIVIGRKGKLKIPEYMKDKFEVLIECTYEVLYKKINESDFILPLLDPYNIEHIRYLKYGTSGSFQLSYGFAKPSIIHKTFADTYGFDSSNCLIYDDEESFFEKMYEALHMKNKEYFKLTRSLRNVYSKIYEVSSENLNKLLNL